MKIFLVITIARQLNGEYVFVRVENAYTSASKVDTKIAELKKQYVDNNGHPKIITLNTPNGSVQCYCEVGPFEVELEE